MSTYQVTRPFSGFEAGDVLTEADFISVHRARQLVDMRYLTQLSTAASDDDGQPEPSRRRGRKKVTNEQTN